MKSLTLHGVAFLLGTIVASPLIAQGRVVDLTGRPAAALDEPFTAISGVREVAPDVVIMSDVLERRLVRSNLATGEVRDIGRQGDGPGEWRLPMAVLPGKGRDSYIPDMMQGKLHVVSPDGQITRSVPMSQPGATGMSMIMPRVADGQGRLFYTGSPITGAGQPADSIAVLRTDFLSSNPGVDTMAMTTNRLRISTSSSGGASVTMSRPAPYQARDSWTALPDGRVAIVKADPYRVEIRDNDRPPVVGPTVDYTPVKVGKAERDAYRERMKNATGMMVTRNAGTGGGGTQARTTPVGGADTPDEDFPDVLPPFDPDNGVVAAPNGEIWVRRYSSASATQVSYDIFSPTTGRRVGTARLRAHSRIAAFGNGSAYVVRQDPADDLLYLERYVM